MVYNRCTNHNTGTLTGKLGTPNMALYMVITWCTVGVLIIILEHLLESSALEHGECERTAKGLPSQGLKVIFNIDFSMKKNGT